MYQPIWLIESTIGMVLSDLLQAIEPLHVQGATDVEVHAIQFDSRKVEAGDLFVAQAGTAVDGHTFIASCIDKGARVIVLDKPDYLPQQPQDDVTYVLVKSSEQALGRLAHQWYGRPSEKLTLVGAPMVRSSQRKTDACRRHRHQRQDNHRHPSL